MTVKHKGPGDVLTLTAPYNRTSGQGLLVGAIFAVALATVLSGAPVEAATVGEWTLDKATSETWAVGDKIYWDNSNKNCTKLGTGVLIGTATAVAGSSATEGNVRLTGGLPAASDVPVAITAATATIVAALHAGKTLVLDRAAGIAVTLPDATGTGDKYRFVVKTTFAGAASIKSSRSADVMIGHALMGNNSDNTVVDWPAVAGSTLDTIDLFGTANSTGGIEGQIVELEDIGTNLWFAEIRGDAAGTEATPFANTVS